MGERSTSGRFTPDVTDEEILAAVRAHEPAATSEVAGEVDMTRQGADKRLRALRDEGRVNSKKIAASLVWFDADAESGRESAETPIDAQDDPTPRPDPTTQTTPGEAGEIDATDATAPDPIGDALGGWEPDTEADAKPARGQTRRAAEYLRDHAPDRFRRSELQDALGAGSSWAPRHWWERAVRPGLHHLAEHGIVEYRAGHHDYRWAGEESGDDPTEEF